MNSLINKLNNKMCENLVYSIILFIGPNEENILFHKNLIKYLWIALTTKFFNYYKKNTIYIKRNNIHYFYNN